MRFLIFVGLLFVSMTAFAQQTPPVPIGEDAPAITSENVTSLTTIETLDADTKQVLFSPDGEKVAIAIQHQDFDYNIIVYAIQSGEAIISIQGRMDFFRELTWSPDSERIATVSGRRTGSGVEERSLKTYTITASESNPYVMGNADTWYADYVYPQDQPENPVSIAWGPSSDMLAVAFLNRLVVLDAIQEEELFSTELPDIEFVQWGAKGAAIITRTEDGLSQIWRIAADEG